MEDPIYRLLISSDLPEVIKLMEEIRPPIAGLRSRQIYAALCHAALKSDKVVFVIAVQQTKFIGFLISIVDYKCFWRKFLCRHILLATQIIFRRFSQRFHHTIMVNNSHESSEISEYLSRHPTQRSWNDSSPFIGKVVYIWIKMDFRKRGIGISLSKFHDKILLQRGVKRSDAKIDPHNIASIRMFHVSGRQIVRESDGVLFATIDLK